ncbi:MAG: DUF4935 domain-containing protein [Chloroflexi bacterium]|nr:DUF4935 domain-containing protein [Chloroflexota bacterium]
MYIVLDTQPIFQDFYLSHAATKSLLDGARSRGWVVCIPEVVIEEMVADYREAMDKAIRKNRRGLDLAALRTDRGTELGIELETEVDEYRRKLDDLLKEREVRVLNLPEVATRELFERNRGRRRPFKSDGRGTGLNDVLIWMSILELYENADAPIALITGDGDYAEARVQPAVLHPDLLADLRLPTAGVQQEVNMEEGFNIELHQTIKGFIEAYLDAAPEALIPQPYGAGQEPQKAIP